MKIEGHDVLELCLTAIEQDLKTLDIMKQYVRIENNCLTLAGVDGMPKKSIVDNNDYVLLKDKLTAKAPNCIIKLVSLGEMRGDCTCSYDVELKPNTTLKELIEYVLTNLNEWGYFHCERLSVEYDKSGNIKGENSLLPFYDRKIKIIYRKEVPGSWQETRSSRFAAASAVSGRTRRHGSLPVLGYISAVTVLLHAVISCVTKSKWRSTAA